MSYQVLARKWRPRTFREMVGQEHVLRALINALDNNRLHHAYLFSGTRGVGKTTIARILAKCLNCETGVSSEPCGECSACLEIAEGRFVDLIEVDAASRTKVEDTRELLDNVQYAPARGRYKIYLIDEVHMLSNHSFNALLKTLEEPPEHVKFLLATTDPQKLPVTILSRCLQFNLKNLSPEIIVDHLQHVLTQELVPLEEAALWQLARSADGSMRDALSLADQAVAFGGGKVQESEVATMLGTIDRVLIEEVVGALVDADGAAILSAIARFAEHSPDYDMALADLITILHRIAIAQALPEALDNSVGDRTKILKFAGELAPEDVQLFYQTALIGRRDLLLASDPRIGFEMTLLRMLVFKPQGLIDVPSRAFNASVSQGERDSGKEIARGKKPLLELKAGDAIEPARPHLASPIADIQYAGEPSPAKESERKTADTTAPDDIEQGLGRVNHIDAAGQKPERPTPRESDSVVLQSDNAQEKSAEFPAPKIALTNFTSSDWVSVCHQIGFKGIVQSTAANCVVLGREENRIHFLLDEEKTSLYDPSHGHRMADLLSDYFNCVVKVDVQLSRVPVGIETPNQHDERVKMASRAEALKTLRDDPVVRILEQEFDAVLQENTVKYPSQ